MTVAGELEGEVTPVRVLASQPFMHMPPSPPLLCPNPNSRLMVINFHCFVKPAIGANARACLVGPYLIWRSKRFVSLFGAGSEGFSSTCVAGQHNLNFVLDDFDDRVLRRFVLQLVTYHARGVIIILSTSLFS